MDFCKLYAIVEHFWSSQIGIINMTFDLINILDGSDEGHIFKENILVLANDHHFHKFLHFQSKQLCYHFDFHYMPSQSLSTWKLPFFC